MLILVLAIDVQNDSLRAKLKSCNPVKIVLVRVSPASVVVLVLVGLVIVLLLVLIGTVLDKSHSLV